MYYVLGHWSMEEWLVEAMKQHFKAAVLMNILHSRIFQNYGTRNTSGILLQSGAFPGKMVYYYTSYNSWTCEAPVS